MAAETHALLVILQAMDGSGKDSTIKQVASAADLENRDLWAKHVEAHEETRAQKRMRREWL